MNPQFPGQYGQGPPQNYGGQSQPGPPGPQGGPPGPMGGMRQPMYNGQPMTGPGQFGGPKSVPISNGPHVGPGPGQFGSGPQGDQPRMGGPGMIPPRGPAPPGAGPGQMGMPRGPSPQHMGQGPRPPVSSSQMTNQMTNQMGGMNLSGPPFRGQPPMSNNPPSSTSQGYGQPGRGPTPTSMGPGSGGMGYQHTSMGSAPAGTGSPSNVGMAPPTSMGMMPPSSMGMAPPTSMGMGPPPTSLGPPANIGPPPASMGHPPTSMGMVPPTSMGMAPPTRMGAPPTSTGIGPPSGMGAPTTGIGAPPTGMGMRPPTSMGPPVSGGMGPPASMGNPNYSGGQQDMGQGYNAAPAGIEMRPPSQPSFGAPPTSNMAGPNSPAAGYGQPPSFPPSSQYGGAPGGQPGYQQDQYMGGAAPQGYQQGFGGPQGARPGGPGMQPGPAMQPPQQKKLDPDQMPSPLQVIEDDKRNRSGVFSTAVKGAVPPLVTTPFITQDQGNCNPSFMRSTMYNIPCTSDMLKSSHIPLALNISPFAKLQPEESPPPKVDLGELGPVRCKRCKAYMNPYMMFIDGGRRFQCVFCGAATDVPNEYFAHLDHTGRRTDCYDRAELCLGSYELVATKDYCKNSVLPNAPAFIFMIDVSYNSVKSGLVQLVCERLKNEILVNLPKEVGAEESEIRVGFVTYAKEIHFYNVKGSLAQPQMLVVSDLEDVFVPLLDGFLVTLAESEAVIDSLLSQIPQMFAESRETEIVLGPVIQAGLDALKSADRAGKLYIFHTSLPIAEAPGKLKNRDDKKLLGTDKEKTILSPQTNFYSKLATECVAAGCSVDLFLFPNSYCDVATMSDICRLTSGNMYKYSYFQADLDGDRFMEDLKNNIQSQTAFDAIIRVRTSQGIRPVDFLGNFYMSNTTDVEMCAVDSNQGITVEIKHDDKLNESEGAYIQVAVLFTSISGQRRLRIHNLSLNCCTQLADLFRNCELDTTINYMAKFAIRNVLNKNPRETREHIMNQTAQILACYRKNCASPSSAGQLILPECMKLLPVYSNCVIKNDGIQGGQDISTDDRSYLMHLINSMDVKSSCAFFYPRLLPMHDLDPQTTELPVGVRCSAERLQDDGVYLLENGVSMFLWLGHNVTADWVQKVFGVQSAAQIDIDKCRLLDLDNDVSQTVRGIIQKVRSSRNRYMKLTIVRQRDKLEPWFHHFLVEDKGLNGSASYVDFLCHIHKEIRNLLS